MKKKIVSHLYYEAFTRKNITFPIVDVILIVFIIISIEQ